MKPGIDQVQALADISCLALWCHSNKIHAPIANPPNTAHLEGTLTILPGYIRVCALVWGCSEGQTHKHTDTQTAVANIHFALAMPYMKCNEIIQRKKFW